MGRARGGTPPRLVVQCTAVQREQVKEQAERHGFEAYGPFMLEIAIEGTLLHPKIRRALADRAKSSGLSARSELERLLLLGLEAEAAATGTPADG